MLFVGDRYEATVLLDGGQTALVYLPAEESWSDGQQVVLHLRPDEVRLWTH